MEAHRRPRARKSIAHLPSPDEVEYNKENGAADNATTALDLKSLAKGAGTNSRRGRSRSLGPEGLDALRQHDGNRQKVCARAVVLLR